jgi:D-3-phosphoglycerate dehydrogenase / 2-oxoglutarate reductase
MPRRILIADPLDPAGLEILRQAGAELHLLTPEERPRLRELVAGFDAMIVRSGTRVDGELLEVATNLKVVGRAGIGVDNVDVAKATDLGVLVVNAPTANLLSATEHTFALLLALARNVSAADASVKRGEWDRKRFVGVELQGKSLGVVGLGRIGQSVAARALAFEMKVRAHDPFLDSAVARRLEIEMLPLDELLAASEFVTLHVPLTDQTRNLLNAERIARLRPGALLVNCARGGVVDERALLQALEEERVGGVALDVFAEEPPQDLALARHPRVVATPHIGAQTREAQERVATETARMVLDALDGSLAVTAVNLPFSSTGLRGQPFLSLGERLGRLAAELLGGSLQSLQVDLWGVEPALRAPIGVAVVKGALMPHLGEAVNYINAERIADARGVEVSRVTHQHAGEYPHLVGVKLVGEGRSVELAGTLFGEGDQRVVRFSGYRLEFRPEGRLLVIHNKDVPGVLGLVGTMLGEAGSNIAEIHLARDRSGGEAVSVFRLDQAPAAGVLRDLAELDAISEVHLIDLGGVRAPGQAADTGAAIHEPGVVVG